MFFKSKDAQSSPPTRHSTASTFKTTLPEGEARVFSSWWHILSRETNILSRETNHWWYVGGIFLVGGIFSSWIPPISSWCGIFQMGGSIAII